MNGIGCGGRIGRRRALTVLAAAAAASLAGGPARRWSLFEWRGAALGAEARIALYGPDREAAAAAVAACVAEIERLENEFSLFRPDSALTRLNRDGELRAPSLDMIRLLQASRRFSESSGGAFDPTVQPLWRLHADHFRRHPGDPAGPARDAVRDALARVGYRRVAAADGRVTLAPGTELTLNGIAQGYVTDRVADLLGGRGWSDVLLDLGEVRAQGGHADGRPWTAALSDPREAGRILARLPLRNRALATSGGYGTAFEPSGRHHHLFDPKRGVSANVYASVSVLAPTATAADALSTALYAAPLAAGRDILSAARDAEAWIVRADGAVAHWVA